LWLTYFAKETEMISKTAAAAIVVLAAITGLAQGASPVAAPAGTPLINRGQSRAGRSGMSSLAGNKTASVQTPATLRERVEDMDGTLVKMHAVLRQMRAKAASSSKDPLAKANLDMWELMVGHLDKQLQELRVAMVAHGDMEARRAAMYKQAEAKADAAARSARDLSNSKAPNPSPATQVSGPGAVGQTPAGVVEPPKPPADASPSAN
jgi:hypothetical protein